MSLFRVFFPPLKEISVTYERGKRRDVPGREGVSSARRITEKLKALKTGFIGRDTVAYHNVCVCCFKVRLGREAERQLVGFYADGAYEIFLE